jgi:glycogen debranching enzyme
MKRDLVIPSFSLHFILECEEYLRYSGDKEFIEKIYPKITSVLDVFLKRIDTVGLVFPFEGLDKWNFYEWTDGLFGANGAEEKKSEVLEYDLALNALLSIAISRMIAINTVLGKDSSDLSKTKEKLNENIYSRFYSKENGLFETKQGSGHFSRLANALALLSGCVGGDVASAVAENMLTDSRVIDASLSMRGFVYDALILIDKEKYKDHILREIDATYTPMLELGNGTVWETVLGESDFDNAGSLCHGWSAIPIYYYHILKND